MVDKRTFVNKGKYRHIINDDLKLQKDSESQTQMTATPKSIVLNKLKDRINDLKTPQSLKLVTETTPKNSSYSKKFSK